MSIVYLILAFSFNAGANILLKLAAGRGLRWQHLSIFALAKENILIILALIFFALNFLFYFLALRNIALSAAYPVMIVMSLLIINFFAVWHLHESLNIWQIIGYALLIAGMALVFLFAKKVPSI